MRLTNNHCSECGRAISVANTDALDRPHRSVPPLPLRAPLVLQGSGATFNWTAGVPPYRVQRATDLTAGDWVDVLTNAIPPVTLTLGRPAEFYRIVGQ